MYARDMNSSDNAPPLKMTPKSVQVQIIQVKVQVQVQGQGPMTTTTLAKQYKDDRNCATRPS
jgi:hypothetical protein